MLRSTVAAPRPLLAVQDLVLDDLKPGGMGLNAINRALTPWTFKHFLLKNAYTEPQIQQMAAQTAFKQAEIKKDVVGMEIWLRK
jgi:hypothetical protein